MADVEPDGGLTDVRHLLHGHPETGFTETWTTATLSRLLSERGLEPETLPSGTGLVADVVGTRPGPLVALRSDIDGLPVTEETGLEFASQNPGRMHACGHDLHMAGLLGAAFWLAAHRDAIAGTVRIVFQPAEETGKGARSVIDGGALEGVEAIAGIHNNPDYAPGEIAVGPEPMMAGCVKFRVDLHAQGTHAGYPQSGTGPLEALASVILALQTIVSRNVTPFHPVVLSVTEVHGGSVWNVIPAEAGLLGTVRYFHKEDSELVGRRFREVVHSTAAAYGITADVVWDDFQDPVVSDPELGPAVAADVPGYARLAPIRPSMAGEDFCEYSTVMPTVFAFVGSNGGPRHHDLHSPRMIVLDEAIAPATRFYVAAALRLLKELAA
ncbi:amidohydrolase [uncultured Bifidobacterium sp.]|uniref:M20 metallopeptidase family protein n=1 Tax=uncultured Bifidobacterium sp. TaxID=165187 RepID=UPI0028DBF283|nr:amidohydrolase [uncultured Bifidobacterium sp.]